jgi:RNA polymerase sigma-70 factor (ECF subfamily)
MSSQFEAEGGLRRIGPSGDPRSRRFEIFFEAHTGDVLRYRLRRLPERRAAEDVAAETFLIAWRRFDVMPADELPWLLAIARNVILNEWRGGRRRERLLARIAAESPEAVEPDPVAAQSAGGDGAGGVRAALAQLSERDREVLMLTAWDGLGQCGAAAVLGCSEGAFQGAATPRPPSPCSSAGNHFEHRRGGRMKTTPELAVALLERSDPVAQERTLDPDDLRVRVAALIADDPSPAPIVAGASPRRPNISRLAALAFVVLAVTSHPTPAWSRRSRDHLGVPKRHR